MNDFKPDFHFSVAPMMGLTDRHARYFFRLLNQNITLFSEMIHTNALLLGKCPEKLLYFDEIEHPVVLQLGGSEAIDLQKATTIGLDFGYNEINLNMGCPSKRVQSGGFGAVLMKDIQHAKDLAQAMLDARGANPQNISVKLRIGVDEMDSEAHFFDLVGALHEAGIVRFFVHARKGWLKGLSTKENRTIPPLNYARVYKLKRTFSNLFVSLNGGITTQEEALAVQGGVDGVMIGRAAAERPLMLRSLPGGTHQSQEKLFDALVAYAKQESQKKGVSLWHVMRPWMGLYHRQEGAKKARSLLSKSAHGENLDTIVQELLKVSVLT